MIGFLFICLLTTVYSKQCYWNSKDPYGYFSTITPYDDVRGDIRDEPPLEAAGGSLRLCDKDNCSSVEKSEVSFSTFSSSKIKPTVVKFLELGCTPVSLWAMVRHGTRHPGGSDTKGMRKAAMLRADIIRNYHDGLGEMCAQDITDLTNWKWDDSLNNTQSYLTVEGYQELLHLGQRVREKYSPLLDGLDSFQFRPTNEQRTKKSAKAFVEGLNNSRFAIEAAVEDENIMRPYKHCDRYNKDIDNDALLEKELKKLYETEAYKQMLKNVRQRTGISALCREDIKALNNLCRFYRAYSINRRDPWCSLFNNDDQRVAEYVKDLTDYYSCGYASPTAAQLGAFPLQNLLENLEAAVNGSRRVTGYFSHDTMMAMTFTALGLFRDYPGLSGLEIDPGRKWRTSFTTPFAANMIVVLNKCSTDDAQAHQVQLFVNEKMVPLCGERACGWAHFREMLMPFKHSTLDFCSV